MPTHRAEVLLGLLRRFEAGECDPAGLGPEESKRASFSSPTHAAPAETRARGTVTGRSGARIDIAVTPTTCRTSFAPGIRLQSAHLLDARAGPPGRGGVYPPHEREDSALQCAEFAPEVGVADLRRLYA